MIFILENSGEIVKTTSGKFFAWYVGVDDWDSVDFDVLKDTLSEVSSYQNIPGVRKDKNEYGDIVKYISKHSKETVTVKIEKSGYYYENIVKFKDGGEISVFTMEMYKD